MTREKHNIAEESKKKKIIKDCHDFPVTVTDQIASDIRQLVCTCLSLKIQRYLEKYGSPNMDKTVASRREDTWHAPIGSHSVAAWVSDHLWIARSVVCSTDSGLSLVTQSPLDITDHNSTNLAVWGLGGLGIKSLEWLNDRRKGQMRALLPRAPQENISKADPRNHNHPLP